MGAHGLPTPPIARRWFIKVIAAAVILRLVLLKMFGPRPSFDSIYEYVPFAHLIRNGTRWMSDAGLADIAVPLTTFRMIGYPALIAFAERIAGDFWPWLMVSVQIGASMAAITSVMLLSQTLEPTRRWVTIAAGLAVATGQTLITDTAIQTDSLSAAALICFAAVSARGALQRQGIGPLMAACLGLLPTVSFLLRENTDVTVLTLLPFAVAWIFRAVPTPWRRLSLIMLVVMPLIAANSVQLSWNIYRTGSAFVTTGTQIILLQALLHAAWTGAPVLDGDGPIDRAAGKILAAKEHPEGLFTQDELWAANQRLFDSGLNAIQISRQMRAAYFNAWTQHPLGMFRATIDNLSGELLFVLGNAVHMNMRALLFGRPGQSGTDAGQFAVGLLLCAFSLALYATSLAITMGFLISPSVAIWRALVIRQPLSEADWFRIGALIASLAFLCLHAIVHFEDRFLAPIEPLAIVSGLTGLAQAWGRTKSTKASTVADTGSSDRSTR